MWPCSLLMLKYNNAFLSGFWQEFWYLLQGFYCDLRVLLLIRLSKVPLYFERLSTKLEKNISHVKPAVFIFKNILFFYQFMLIYSQSRRFFVLFLGRCYKYQHISFHSLLALPLLHCFIKTLFAVSDWIKTRNTREYSELHPSHCFNLSFSIKERYDLMPLKKDQKKYSDWPNISCRKSKYILEFYFLVILIQKKKHFLGHCWS